MIDDDDELEESEEADSCIFNHCDERLVSNVALLLKKISCTSLVEPPHLISVANRVMHLVNRLPGKTEGVRVSIGLKGPRPKFDDREIYQLVGY